MSLADKTSGRNSLGLPHMTNTHTHQRSLELALGGAVSADQAADRLGVCRETVYRMIANHRLTGLKFARAWRIHIPCRDLFPSAA